MTNGSNLQRKPKRSEMSDEERVRDFQRKLYQKAKQDKGYRFYVLYDKIRMPHFLREAYRRVKSKRGSAGIDGITFERIEEAGIDGNTFEKIEESGVEGFLEEIRKELEMIRYKPSGLKRVMIPKGNGKERPIGIPTIKDRVVQMSCKMVIEPIFEADFEDSSYGFRPKRSSADAMRSVREHLQNGNTEIYEADLSSYFDTIPHDKLLKTIGMRISDSNVIHLIKMWLKAPIIEDGRPRGGKKNKIGTPQGGVISPLLSNIYLHLLDRIVNKEGGMFSRCGIKIIRYADDFILMGKGIPETILKKLREVLERMGLRINEEKSRLVKAEISSFEFLGFKIRYDKDIHGRAKRYWNIIPSERSCKKIRDNIRMCLKKMGHLSAETLVKVLNPKIRGWINYFTIEGVSYPAMSKRKLRWYLCDKLYRYYKRKSQRHSKLYSLRAFERLVSMYGLIDPTRYCRLTPVKA